MLYLVHGWLYLYIRTKPACEYHLHGAACMIRELLKMHIAAAVAYYLGPTDEILAILLKTIALFFY